MDLVLSLATTLDLDAAQAQAVAGVVLGTVCELIGPEAAAKLDAAVPELSGWSARAEALLGRTHAAAPAQSGHQTAALVGLLGQLGLVPSKAILAAPLALAFLKRRLPSEWIDRAMAAAPVLAGASSRRAADVFGQLLG